MRLSRRIAVAALAAAALSGPAAGGVTREQIRDLPLPELARLVLGEAGAAMVAVDRPQWTEEGPPRETNLIFYQRSYPGGGGIMGWTGLCQSWAVRVGVAADGHVTGLGTIQFFSVAGRMERARLPVRPEVLAERHRLESERCAARPPPPRGYFRADNEIDAARAAAAAQLFADAVGRGGRLPFELDCSSFNGGCHRNGQGMAEMVAAARFQHVEHVGCRGPLEPIVRFGNAGCYQAILNGASETVTFEIADAYGEMRLKRVVYRHVTLLH